MKLANYAPAGNEILLEMKEYQEGIVKLSKPEHDKIMRVLKIGPTVTILNPLTGKVVAVGDFCLPMSPNMMQFDFEGETPEIRINAVQTKEYGIAAFYKPSPDEKKYMPNIPASEKEYELSREMNIIDNPGIDKSPFLKEEMLNKQFLDSN